MGGKGKWPNRVLEFFRGKPANPLPPVSPKHIRFSGPREVPSDWWDRPELVMRQCLLCHERVLPSEPLHRGLCGPCYLRTSTDTPDAA